MQKFNDGDKVTIRRDNSKTPKWILKGLYLYLPRTIVGTFYDRRSQHTRYYLGGNNRGKLDLSNYAFRSTQLKLWVKGEVGRPRTKRVYNYSVAHSQIDVRLNGGK
jgi:hypothetical protein